MKNLEEKNNVNINTTINIDNYLTEEEKKEIAINYFRESLQKHFTNEDNGKADSERDRHIGNIYHSIILEEVQKYLPNFQDIIKERVIHAITNENLHFQIFRKKDDYFREKQSLAMDYIDEVVKENEELIKEKTLNKIATFNYDEIIIDKLKSLFEESFSDIYDLFDKLKQK